MPSGLPFPRTFDDDNTDAFPNMSDSSDAAAAGSSAAATTDNQVAGPSSAGQTPARHPAAPRSHNLVWVNPDYCPVPKTKDSALSDAQVRERMGLTKTPTGEPTASPSPNQFGKRPKGSGPTPKRRGRRGKREER